jgi:cytochrome c biogenesis protein CcmG/thiol:disulfide interchange protein DsbE
VTGRRWALLLLPWLGACATPNSASTGGGGLPSFELLDLDGNSVRLSDHLGKDVVYLDFWASWCAPCQTQMPQLEALYQKYKERGFLVLGVAMDDPTTVGQVAPAAHKTGATFPILLDSQGRAVTLFNPGKSAPYGVLIDRTGRIVTQHGGYAPGDERSLEAEIQRSL